MAATRPIQQFKAFPLVRGRKVGQMQCLANSINKFLAKNKCGTCLGYCIDKHLCIVHTEAAYHFILIFAREDRFDQVREFATGECASDPASMR